MSRSDSDPSSTPLWPAGHLPLKGGDQPSWLRSPMPDRGGLVGAAKLLISPLEGEMAGRPEGGEPGIGIAGTVGP